MINVLDRLNQDTDDLELGKLDNIIRLVERTFLRSLIGASFVGYLIIGVLLVIVPVKFAPVTDSKRDPYLINVQEAGIRCIEISAWLVGASGAISVAGAGIRFLTAKTAIANSQRSGNGFSAAINDVTTLEIETQKYRAQIDPPTPETPRSDIATHESK